MPGLCLKSRLPLDEPLEQGPLQNRRWYQKLQAGSTLQVQLALAVLAIPAALTTPTALTTLATLTATALALTTYNDALRGGVK